MLIIVIIAAILVLTLTAVGQPLLSYFALLSTMWVISGLTWSMINSFRYRLAFLLSKNDKDTKDEYLQQK